MSASRAGLTRRCCATSASVVAAAALFAALPFLPGCKANFLNENDRLRRENLGLKDQVQQLNRSLSLREAEVKQLEKDKTPQVLQGVQGVEVPRLVTMEFDRFSGLIDAAPGEAGPKLRLYIKAIDQEGRFIPVAGQAQVQVVSLQPSKPPQVLADLTFGPEFDAAYRSGLTGTHFTLEIPLGKPLPPDVDSLTAKLSFRDAATGATVNQEGVFPLKATASTPAGTQPAAQPPGKPPAQPPAK